MSTPTAPLLEVARASRLNAKLRLEQITLFELAAKHLRRHDSPRHAYALGREPVRVAATDGLLIGIFPLLVRIQHEAEDGTALDLAQLTVVTRAAYRQEPGWTLEDDAFVPDYLGLVGWMHVWPYARAEVQSLSVKLGFPPLLLPVLLAGQTADARVSRLEPAAAASPPPAEPAPEASTPAAVSRVDGPRRPPKGKRKTRE